VSIVRLEALRFLARQIEAGVPELSGKTRVVQVPPEQQLDFPMLVVIGANFRRITENTDEHSRPTNSTLCVCVGHWDVTVQLRLAHATQGQRDELADKIDKLFDQREGAPGVLVSRVVACKDVGPFFASWEQDSSSWDDEAAFSSQYWSTCTLTGWVPVLVVRNGVYNLDHLQLGLTKEFDVPATSAAFDTMPGVVEVHEDGTITPVPRS
jgi:hypothetical protein